MGFLKISCLCFPLGLLLCHNSYLSLFTILYLFWYMVLVGGLVLFFCRYQSILPTPLLNRLFYPIVCSWPLYQILIDNILLLGIYPNKSESSIQRNLCTPMFIAVLFTISKGWKQPKCPSVNGWITKLWYIYTMEYYAAERKKELLSFMTAWMELGSIILSEISQLVKDRYHMISLRRGI